MSADKSHTLRLREHANPTEPEMLRWWSGVHHRPEGSGMASMCLLLCKGT